MAPHTLIAAATKGIPTFSCYYDNANLFVLTTNVHGIDHFIYSQWCKCIMDMGSIDANTRYTFEFMKYDLFIFLNRLPGEFIVHNSFLFSVSNFRIIICLIPNRILTRESLLYHRTQKNLSANF